MAVMVGCGNHRAQFHRLLVPPPSPRGTRHRPGGGVVHSQAAHQINVIRLLAQSPVQIVQAHTGAWDPVRPTEGAYSALLGFADSSFASATYSGYGHFDSDIFMDNISEIGLAKNSNDYGRARRRLATMASTEHEARLKQTRNYGGSDYQDLPSLPEPEAHQHFGVIVVSCDHADLRPTAQEGIAIDFDEDLRSFRCPRPCPAKGSDRRVVRRSNIWTRPRPLRHLGARHNRGVFGHFRIRQRPRAPSECTIS